MKFYSEVILDLSNVKNYIREMEDALIYANKEEFEKSLKLVENKIDEIKDKINE